MASFAPFLLLLSSPTGAADDLTTLDGTLSALYSVISGPAGQKRDWDRFKGLFAEGAKMISTGVAPDGTVRRRMMTPDEYITMAGPYLEKNGFFEKEVARKSDQFAGIAQVFSTYESRQKADDAKPFARGINSVQLWNDGKRWYVQSILWQQEDPKSPIPKAYLPGG